MERPAAAHRAARNGEPAAQSVRGHVDSVARRRRSEFQVVRRGAERLARRGALAVRLPHAHRLLAQVHAAHRRDGTRARGRHAGRAALTSLAAVHLLLFVLVEHRELVGLTRSRARTKTHSHSSDARTSHTGSIS